jgi:diamine N-acetyltransferase
MDPHITFHGITEADLDQLLILIKEYYEFDHLLFDRTKAGEALKLLLKDPALGRIWLIQQDSNTVGYVILTFGFIVEFHGRHAVIDEFYIREPYRRKGIGKRTLQFIEEFCRSLEIHVLRLEVEKANSVAQELYRRASFEPHPRVLMTKLLR